MQDREEQLLTGSQLAVVAAAISIGEAQLSLSGADPIRAHPIDAEEPVTAGFGSRTIVMHRIAAVVAARRQCFLWIEGKHGGGYIGEFGRAAQEVATAG